MKKKYIISIMILLSNLIYSQNKQIGKCNIKQLEESSNIFLLEKKDINCITQSNNDKNTILYTYASWCPPCVAKLPLVKEFAKENNLNLYIILFDAENSRDMRAEINKFKKDTLNVIFLSDKDYERRMRKKIHNFLKPFYGEKKAIEDLSKVILLNKSGQVLYISSYKDKKNFLEDKIKPLLN